jgi:predicted transcriptional regulator
MKGDEMVGILTRSALVQGLAKGGPTVNIASVMDQSFIIADVNEMLERVSERLQSCGCHTVPIFENQKLIGLVTMDNIGEFLMIQSALKRSSMKQGI